MSYFAEAYKHLRNVLNKKQISDDYIDNAAALFNADRWSTEILKKLFADLSTADPYKIDISANAMKSAYWDAVRKEKGMGSSSKQRQCPHKQCNGFGLVMAVKEHNIIKGHDFGHAEVYFKCNCLMGQDVPGSAEVWGDGPKSRGWKINQDKVFIDDESQAVTSFDIDGRVQRLVDSMSYIHN